MDTAQAAAKDGEVLAEDVDQTAVDRPPTGNDAVAHELLLVHAEVGLAMHDQGIHLVEGAFVQQDIDALAGGQLALGLVGRQTVFATAQVRLFLHLPQLFDLGVRGWVHGFII